MPIHRATKADLDGWIDLRAQLWPATSRADHRAEALAILDRTDTRIALLDRTETGTPRAFAEATLRHDHVNGCETSPVPFLEGIFVVPDHRGTGLGRALVGAVRDWARETGCTELASDADLGNTASHAFHAALGFQETERVVFFRTPL